MNDTLKKPVHHVLMKDTLIEKLRREGRLKGDHVFAAQESRAELPRENKQANSLVTKVMIPRVGQASNIAKQSVLRSKLRVIHDSVPSIPPDKQPPCDTCKTAACCRAFIVSIEPEEYESGLYGEYAIEMTEEMRKQLHATGTLMPIAMNVPSLFDHGAGTAYYLEGVVGQPCPFLGKDNRCTIYADRPITCRAYTCVGDDRITQDMRDGKVDIADAMQAKTFK